MVEIDDEETIPKTPQTHLLLEYDIIYIQEKMRHLPFGAFDDMCHFNASRNIILPTTLHSLSHLLSMFCDL